jgi:GT2 family glycosyltransferase
VLASASDDEVATLSPAAQVVPVAVVIPSYRRKSFLPLAVASVASQVGVKPQEVIVVDDGSNDGTAELAAGLGARVIQKTVNEGLSAARDDALNAAGDVEWVAMLDDDDQWLPHHLQTVWAARGDHVLVGASSLSFGSTGNRVHGARGARPEVVTSPGRLLFPDNSFTTSAILVRRDALARAGGFNRSLRYTEDIDAWLRVLELGTGLLLPDLTCLYRVHQAQLTSSRDAMRTGVRSVTARYADRPWMSDALKERREVIDAWDDLQAARRARQWGQARQYALWLAARPARMEALAHLWAFRRDIRRREVPPALVRLAHEQTARYDGAHAAA